MRKDEWFNQANQSKDKLISLIGYYHPACLQGLVGMRITAPNAEMVSERIRESIRKNFDGNPVTEFITALDNKDISKCMKLLNDAWFGVPESTDCWKISGFKECVDLLDEPPDEE